MKELAAAAGTLVLAGPAAQALGKSCALTPAQTPGPFYPGESNFSNGYDLTTAPNGARALGQVIYVQGRILNPECRPVAAATVEIWQACASGRYNNPGDPNTAPLDPNFGYWAEQLTSKDGRYAFKTILPGAYPADVNWMRPPHIHFKISCLGHKDLVTQMYFQGNEYNDRDLILRDVPAAERPSVIVGFEPPGPELEPGSLAGTFDLTLVPVR